MLCCLMRETLPHGREDWLGKNLIPGPDVVKILWRGGLDGIDGFAFTSFDGKLTKDVFELPLHANNLQRRQFRRVGFYLRRDSSLSVHETINMASGNDIDMLEAIDFRVGKSTFWRTLARTVFF